MWGLGWRRGLLNGDLRNLPMVVTGLLLPPLASRLLRKEEPWEVGGEDGGGGEVVVVVVWWGRVLMLLSFPPPLPLLPWWCSDDGGGGGEEVVEEFMDEVCLGVFRGVVWVCLSLLSAVAIPWCWCCSVAAWYCGGGTEGGLNEWQVAKVSVSSLLAWLLLVPAADWSTRTPPSPSLQS